MAQAHPKGMIDWAALNLTASVALGSLFFQAGYEIISFAIPRAVQSGVSGFTLYLADYALSYGLPFAGAFLLIRALDLAAPLKAAPVVAWILFLCSVVLHVDRGAFALEVLLLHEPSRLTGLLFFLHLPLPVRQATALGIAAAWLWVVGGFVVALLRGRTALHLPTRPDIAVAFVAGVALPAAALAPFVPMTIKYRELYAAQETRFRELCKSVKTEILGAASGSKSVFFDPNESMSCWDMRDGQCQALSQGDKIAQYMVINWQFEFVEFWEAPGHAKPPELKRCYRGDDCRTIAKVTAKHRVLAREIQSKADEAMGLHHRVVTVDERETGKILGRLQYVYSMETHRLCAPGAEEGRDFDTYGFIVRALGVEPRKRPDR